MCWKATDVGWVRRALLKWFHVHGRNFPWRHYDDPYAILVTEILLKKTGATTIASFGPTFLTRYPNPNSLARASLEAIKRDLTPVGLSYQRAQQLKALGEVLVKDYGGQIPTRKETLRALPGVGDYTTGAILCFGYGLSEPIVDTNVARVIVRVLGLIPSRYEARRSPEVWEAARALISRMRKGRAKQVNWALLDMGALICKPKHPRCHVCPISGRCRYFSTLSQTDA